MEATVLLIFQRNINLRRKRRVLNSLWDSRSDICDAIEKKNWSYYYTVFFTGSQSSVVLLLWCIYESRCLQKSEIHSNCELKVFLCMDMLYVIKLFWCFFFMYWFMGCWQYLVMYIGQNRTVEYLCNLLYLACMIGRVAHMIYYTKEKRHDKLPEKRLYWRFYLYYPPPSRLQWPDCLNFAVIFYFFLVFKKIFRFM